MTAYGETLWQPPPDAFDKSRIGGFARWLTAERGMPQMTTYQEIWEWSATDLDGFWTAVWDFFEIKSRTPRGPTITGDSMPGIEWFSGARLNYAEHMLSRRDRSPAVIARSETRDRIEISFEQLAHMVGAAQAHLRELGVEKGDRVAAFSPNIPETLVMMLATASIGAIWSSCAPEFGTGSVVSRLQQIEPKILLAVDGYVYGGKRFDKTETVAEILAQLPSVEAVVWIACLGDSQPTFETIAWDEFLAEPQDPGFEVVPFSHPLWILFSSGTTGAPKGIVHSHGGITIELLKMIALQADLGPGDRFFWFSTTGWMMWNYLISGLMAGTTIVIYDGNPGYPDLMALWQMAAEESITYFGTSAPFLHACMKAGLRPGDELDLTSIKSIGSTGSPLSPEGFGWVYEAISTDLLLGSVSGGTDMCTAFVASSVLLPVRAGELQCRSLGAAVEAFSPTGQALTGETGELVITKPMPSMPVFFWDDPDGRRYHDAYFDMFPGIWRHGDWIKIEEDGSCVIFGRSDATLNRDGVRMGTSEFYRVIEGIVADSVVVHTDSDQLILFVVPGDDWDPQAEDHLKDVIRRQLSPRHVPDEIHVIDEVPRTLSGKKLEIPIKRILAGSAPGDATRLDALANPVALQAFRRFQRD